MAFFGVTLEEISEVNNHPNADRLSLAKVKGLSFQFVIGKDQFSIGDKVLYFPIDSILPENVLTKLNLVGKLSGKSKDRLKTVKLRDEISQGLVCHQELFLNSNQLHLSPEEITELLGITKYEEPVQFTNTGTLVALPEGISVYDIEGADRYGNVVEYLLDEEVVVLEKMEGTNFSCGTVNSIFVVNQRNHSIIEEDKNNSYWDIARKYGLIDKIKESNLIVYGEFCGPKIQKNIYNLKEQTLFVFDVKRNGKWLPWEEVLIVCKELGLNTVPELFKGNLSTFLGTETIQSKSNGKSIHNDKIMREGIVVKPLTEGTFPKIGRLILKQRSPLYLAGSDA